MLTLDVAERRRRLAVRHGLARASGLPRPADPAEVARRLVALHGTDPATVYLAIRARTADACTPAVIDRSFYERRDLVRMLAMRRTVFAVPAESVPVIQIAVSEKIAVDQRVLALKLLRQAAGIPEPVPWLAEVERSVLRIMATAGRPLTAAELTAAEPRLRTKMTLAEGKPYAATQNITSRVLLVLAAEGKIMRGQPVGSWLSQQYRWALADEWLPATAAGERPHLAPASAELARQWLAAFGPAPLADLRWWTGWTTAQARQAVAAAGAIEVELDGGPGLALPGDLEPTPDPGPWAALLPALDPTVMGWSDRSWFLGPHGQALFDANGNAGPTVWVDGRVVGGWAQRSDGEIVLRLLEHVGAEATALIEMEADRLTEWLGDVRVKPRFRTPTERALSA
jgi:hypothetical protein